MHVCIFGLMIASCGEVVVHFLVVHIVVFVALDAGIVQFTAVCHLYQ